MYLNYNMLTVGDRLVREKGGVFSKHHVIYAGVDRYNRRIVAENQVGYGVRCITLNKFLSEGRLIRIEHNYASYRVQQVIINRINQRLGRPYHWFSYNCEHFVNEVLLGKRKSPQIEMGTGIGFGALAIFLMAGRG